MVMNSGILVLANDASLQQELQAAAGSMLDEAPRLRFVADDTSLQEELRSRPPFLVLVDAGKDWKRVMRVAAEIGALRSPVPVVALFRPDGFVEDVAESVVLIEAMRAGVRDFLRRPLAASEFRRLIESLRQDPRSEGATPVSRSGVIVSFISNKGGVGKSTLAANTAVALAMANPGRVLLVDASLQMGVAASLLDVPAQTTLADLAVERDRLDATLLRQMAIQHRSGLHLLAAPPDAIAAMDVDDAVLSRILTLARQAYDFVIVDTFPMFDRIVVAALDFSDRAYIILENVVPTLRGANSLLSVLDRIGFEVSRQKLIVNRFQNVTGSLPLADVASSLGRTIDFVFPLDHRVISAANAGIPIAMRGRWPFGFRRVLPQLVQEVASLLESPIDHTRRREDSSLNSPSSTPAPNSLDSALRMEGIA